MNSTSISIFNYNDPSLFMRDHWLEKKEKNENFSIRAWAQNLGIKSHSQLHEMIYGKRAIPKKYIPVIIKSLKLSKKESIYFESLLSIQQSKSVEEKTFHYEKIRAFAKNISEQIVFEQIENYEIIKSPLHFYLLEILERVDSEFTVDEIQAMLYFNFSKLEIKRSVDILLRHGLLLKSETGTFKKSQKHFFTTVDIPSEAIREHHKQIADLAKMALEVQDVQQREFNSTAFNIDVKDIPRAKEFIREFRESFLNEFSNSSKTTNSTYQFSMNLFAITKPGILQ